MKTIERLNQDWMLATEIHKLETRLWRLAQQDGHKVILITSPSRGEGKTTTSAYLTTALALHPERRILAVDMDFREPKLNTHFGLDVPIGLGAVIRGERPLQDAIITTSIPNLHAILPSAEGEDPHLLLRTRPLAELFENLRRSYDLIIVDVPALVPVADASLLMGFADGVVLVAMAGKTTKPNLRQAQETCEGLGATILGIVIGNLKEAHPEYAGGDYYYYGHRDQPPAREGGPKADDKS